MNTKPINNPSESMFSVEDLVAYNGHACRITGIRNGIFLLPVEGKEEIRAEACDILDIEITEDTLKKNRFVNLANHTLLGPQWRLVNPKDECNSMNLRVHKFIQVTYLDDRVYENYMTQYASTLRELQHALTANHFKIRLEY